jgi:mycoredoxin
MNKWILLAVIAAAVFYFKDRLVKPEYLSAEQELVLFTFEGCKKPCADMVNELDSRGVTYDQVVVERAGESYERYKSLGGGNFPMLVSQSDKLNGFYKPALTGFLAKNIDDNLLTDAEYGLLSQHFYDDGSPKVVMYGASWCGYCAKLRKELNDSGVPFDEVDVDASAEKSFITKTLEIPGYPTMYVGYLRITRPSVSVIEKTLARY